jgi:hypothetical protein
MAMALEVGSNDDISILVGGFRLDHHVISITDVLLNHGLTLDKEGYRKTWHQQQSLDHASMHWSSVSSFLMS